VAFSAEKQKAETNIKKAKLAFETLKSKLLKK
jgi:hypothetical protein